MKSAYDISFYLYLTPCLNDIVINTQSSDTKPAAKKKGKKKCDPFGDKGEPGPPQLSKELKAKQRKNTLRQERRLCQKKKDDQVRSAIGLPSLSSDKCDSEKYAKPGSARDQLEMIKKNFDVWNVENSRLPESERESFAYYHREILGGEVAISGSAFQNYCVEGKLCLSYEGERPVVGRLLFRMRPRLVSLMK